MAIQIQRKTPAGQVIRKTVASNAVAVIATHVKDSKNYMRCDVEENSAGISGSIYAKDLSQPITVPLSEVPIKGLHAVRGKDSAKKKRYDIEGSEEIKGLLYILKDSETPDAIEVTFQEPAA